MSGNSNFRSLCKSCSVVYFLSCFSLMKPCCLSFLFVYCVLLISLKSYLWGIHVFLQKGFAFASASSLESLPVWNNLNWVRGSPEWWELWLWIPSLSVLLTYRPDALRALETFPEVLVWVCRFSSSLSLCWVLWGSSVMWKGSKTEMQKRG